MTQAQKSKYLAEFWKTAYQMAEDFRSEYLADDVKENIALKALERAIDTFDEGKRVKFTTYLRVIIRYALGDEIRRVKRRGGVFIRERSQSDPSGWVAGTEDSTTSWDDRSVFDLVAIIQDQYQSDPVLYTRLINGLRSRLSTRQSRLLDIFMTQEKYLDAYNQRKPTRERVRKLTYKIIGGMLGISASSVLVELQRIRRTTTELLDQIGYEGNVLSI